MEDTISLPPDFKDELLRVSAGDTRYFSSKVRWIRSSGVRITEPDKWLERPTGFLFSIDGVALSVDCSLLAMYSLQYEENMIVLDYDDACVVGLTLVEIKTGEGPLAYPKRERGEN